PVPSAPMSDSTRDPRPPIPPGFLDHFAWHPEPELLGIRDPEASREALRAAGAAAWEAGLDYLYDHALDRAMGASTGFSDLRAGYFGPSGEPGLAPDSPTPLPALLEEFRTRIAPHTVSAYHPRSFGYFTPPPLIASIVGEVLSQFAQQGVDIFHAGPIAATMEEEVVRWLCDLVGYDRDAFGLLTSGGVMANFIAMALVRDVHVAEILDLDQAPRGRALEGLRVYTGDQSHFSIGRALDELGFPSETLVTVPADADFRLRGAAIAEAVAADRRAGLTPVAIAAVAGSTNTGAVDAIGELADVAGREGLWLHVDAAYGAAVRLSARDADRVADLQRADSVTVDPHKWFFQAYDIGGLMVRQGELLEHVFGARLPEYYRAGHGSKRAAPARRAGRDDSGTSGEAASGDNASRAATDHDAGMNFWKLGFEGTRRWRALKLWFSWRHLGTSGFGRLIEANNDLAAHLAAVIAASPDFEALPSVPPLSVVCFRHLVPRLDAHELDLHQDQLQRALESSGAGWVSTTRLRDGTWLRAGILNTQATESDVEGLLDTLRELAEGLD
ncbi:MAG: pyridoxal-dependent decarboxylase, partial [Candidatus Limnocylindrales bacterium]